MPGADAQGLERPEYAVKELGKRKSPHSGGLLKWYLGGIRTHRGYLMTGDYAGYNAVAAQDGIERLGCCWAHARRKFVDVQKVQPKGKTGHADMVLNLIKKLYGIELDLNAARDEERLAARQQRSLPLLVKLKAWLAKTKPQVAGQAAPKMPFARSSLGARTGCSATPHKEPPPAHRSIA